MSWRDWVFFWAAWLSGCFMGRTIEQLRTLRTRAATKDGQG